MKGSSAGVVSSNDSDRLPRLCRGLAVIRQPDALLIEGSQQRVRLTGRAATTTVPALLALLDGQHTPDEICSQLDLQTPYLDQVLELLEAKGLLEFTPARPTYPQAPPDIARYFSRTARSSGGHECSEDILATLANTAVLLVSPARLAERIAPDLLDVGVGSVLARESADWVSPDDVLTIASAPRSAAAVLDLGDRPDSLDKIISLCGDSDIPVLRFAEGSGHLEVGPVFYHDWTACSRCFRRGYDSRWSVSERSLHAADGKCPGGAVDLLCGLVTGEILALTARTTPCLAVGRMCRFAVPGYATKAYDVVPDAGCESCAGTLPEGDTSSSVEAYERREAFSPRELAWTGALSQARQDLIAALQTQREQFPSAPRHQLPDVDPVAACSMPSTSWALDERMTASLLRCVAGRRTGSPRDDSPGFAPRWAPTGGNLGSVEVYLAANRPLFDLPGTVYKYDDIAHQVISVMRNRVPLTRILGSTDLAPESLDFAMILVAAVGRLRQKYYDFSLRVSHLDAGCATLQLASFADACGLSLSFASTWSEEVADSLELRVGEEIVTAIAGVSQVKRVA